MLRIKVSAVQRLLSLIPESMPIPGIKDFYAELRTRLDDACTTITRGDADQLKLTITIEK